MPDKATLRANAQEKLDDARALYAAGRYDGAAYVCGYAVEFTLKARICDLLDVDPYPESLAGYKIHLSETLLLLTGRRNYLIKNPVCSKLWSLATDRWKPDMRYAPSGSFTQADALEIIETTRDLLPFL